MELKKGYKQTDIGVIPKDWEVKRLNEIAPLQRGFDLPNKELQKGIYPVVCSNGIVNYHNKFQTKAPGIITGRSGTIGKVTFVEDDYWPHNTTLWVTDFKGNNPKYIYYLYLSIKLERFATGSGVPTLNRNDVHSFCVPLPPTKAEQTAIATALSDADALIQSMEKLIAKKRLIKQGAMQELLKPKEDWVVKKLGKICDFQNGTSLERFFNKNEGYSVISIGNYSSSGKYVETNTFIDKVHSDEIAKFLLKKNELTLLMNDKTSIGTIIGRVLLIEQDDKYVFNQRTMRLKPKNNYNSLFLYHLINSDFIHKKIVLLAKPGTQIYVNTNDIIDLELFIPKPEEQTRIATILSDIDTEISAMETKLAKYKQVKQGMMQELLTGRIRLV